jgi:hypothetical protein
LPFSSHYQVCECRKEWDWPRREGQEIEWAGDEEFNIDELFHVRAFFNGKEFGAALDVNSTSHNKGREQTLKQMGVVGDSRVLLVITEH